VFRTNVHRDFTVWSEGYAGASVDEIITNHGLSRSLINAILLRGDRAVRKAHTLDKTIPLPPDPIGGP
ncbi:MAG TPA: hypothetical protein VGC15_15500, partial [Acetobacteraceae bacterium]